MRLDNKILVDQSTLTIWDSTHPCPITNEPVILWKQFKKQGDSPLIISIPDYVESHAEELRDNLLELIYEVGNRKIGKKKLTEYLSFESGFSYFWMTNFHARPYIQSAQLSMIAKIISILEIVNTQTFQNVSIYSRDKHLVQILKDILKNNNSSYQILSPPRERPVHVSTQTRIRSHSPSLLLSGFALFNKIRIYRHMKKQETEPSVIGNITFIDYWYRFGSSVKSTRKFQSQYWTSLVDALSRSQIQVNWFHHIVDEKSLDDFTEAASLCNDFNKSSQYQQHLILDFLCSPSVAIRSVRQYLKLLLCSFPLNKFKTIFVIPNSQVNIWPLIRAEWRHSLRGYEAMNNCVRFNILERILSKLPQQKIGIYLMENQPWEMAMIHLWSKYRHIRLVGVAHSTVRFWDLRLLSDPKSFAVTKDFPIPRPNLVAVNGPLARQSLINANYPGNELVDVEALMYLHLEDLANRPRHVGQFTLLVATDFLESATRTQMKILDDYLTICDDDIRIILKPHWSQTFKKINPRIEIVSGKEDLATFFGQCDVMYCSTITSAVIDGVCANLPVIQCLDPTSFNLSPLRQHPDIQFIRNGEELARALKRTRESVSSIDQNNLLNFDSSLKKWRELLDI